MRHDLIFYYVTVYNNFKNELILSLQYQNAAVIETEACFKGARIAVKYNSPLQAHTLLQSVIFINLTLNEEEKVSIC